MQLRQYRGVSFCCRLCCRVFVAAAFGPNYNNNNPRPGLESIRFAAWISSGSSSRSRFVHHVGSWLEAHSWSGSCWRSGHEQRGGLTIRLVAAQPPDWNSILLLSFGWRHDERAKTIMIMNHLLLLLFWFPLDICRPARRRGERLERGALCKMVSHAQVIGNKLGRPREPPSRLGGPNDLPTKRPLDSFHSAGSWPSKETRPCFIEALPSAPWGRDGA